MNATKFSTVNPYTEDEKEVHREEKIDAMLHFVTLACTGHQK